MSAIFLNPTLLQQNVKSVHEGNIYKKRSIDSGIDFLKITIKQLIVKLKLHPINKKSKHFVPFFKSKESLNLHIATAHEAKKIQTFFLCKKNFSLEGNLKNHKCLPQKCSICKVCIAFSSENDDMIKKSSNHVCHISKPNFITTECQISS